MYLSDDGSQIVKSVSLSDLTSAQVYQTIGDGGIRSVDQQYKMLVARNKVRAKLPPKKGYRMTSNIRRDGDVLVIAGKHGVTVDLVKKILGI